MPARHAANTAVSLQMICFDVLILSAHSWNYNVGM